MGRVCSTNVEKRNAYMIVAGNSDGKIPLECRKRRWVDNLKMDHTEIGWVGVDWIELTLVRDQWRALVDTVMNLWGP
jgi:hypothetical protein